MVPDPEFSASEHRETTNSKWGPSMELQLPTVIANRIADLEQSEAELVAALIRVRDEKQRLMSELGNYPAPQQAIILEDPE